MTQLSPGFVPTLPTVKTVPPQRQRTGVIEHQNVVIRNPVNSTTGHS